MNEPLLAAWEVSRFLIQHDIPYVVIGGLAVQEWGGARLTVDADSTVAAPLEGSADIVQLITTHFPSRISDPQALAHRARMILIKASNGVDVDISLGLPGYEDELFHRWLNEFSDLLANPDVLQHFEQPYRKLKVK